MGKPPSWRDPHEGWCSRKCGHSCSARAGLACTHTRVSREQRGCQNQYSDRLSGKRLSHLSAITAPHRLDEPAPENETRPFGHIAPMDLPLVRISLAYSLDR